MGIYTPKFQYKVEFVLEHITNQFFYLIILI